MKWKEIDKRNTLLATKAAEHQLNDFFLAIYFKEPPEGERIEREINEYNPLTKSWFYGEATQKGENDFSYTTKPEPSNLEEVLDSINFGDKFYICAQSILGFPLIK